VLELQGKKRARGLGLNPQHQVTCFQKSAGLNLNGSLQHHIARVVFDFRGSMFEPEAGSSDDDSPSTVHNRARCLLQYKTTGSLYRSLGVGVHLVLSLILSIRIRDATMGATLLVRFLSTVDPNNVTHPDKERFVSNVFAAGIKMPTLDGG
jgi:hypothetical protein